MTAKDKAIELVNTMLDKLYDNGGLSFKRILYARAKQCALIAVDEMMNELANLYGYINMCSINTIRRVSFLQEVKKEIEAL